MNLKNQRSSQQQQKAQIASESPFSEKYLAQRQSDSEQLSQRQCIADSEEHPCNRRMTAPAEGDIVTPPTKQQKNQLKKL